MGISLWVDDLRAPARFAHGNWVWAKTITEAIRLLATQHVEVVSLDHDICHTLPIGEKPPDDIETHKSVLFRPITCPENYTAVAYYLRAMPEEQRPWKVIIHTANPVGAKAIADILGDSIKVISIRMAHEINSEQIQ